MNESNKLSSHNGMNPLPDKIFALSKFKTFAEIFNVVQMVPFLLDRVENIAGNGENAGSYQHFLFFLPCFQKASFLGD